MGTTSSRMSVRRMRRKTRHDSAYGPSPAVASALVETASLPLSTTTATTTTTSTTGLNLPASHFDYISTPMTTKLYWEEEGREHEAYGETFEDFDDTFLWSRNELSHRLFRHVLGGDRFAPCGDPTAILDVGCNDGRWAAEIALEYPEAKVRGVDPINAFPDSGLPPNLRLIEADIARGLPFRNDSFDLIHQRDAILTIPFAAWDINLKECLRMLKVGGWLELVEADSLLRSVGPAGERVNAWMLLAAARRGIDLAVPRDLPNMCKAAGFEETVVRRCAAPVGQWGGTPGMYIANGYRESLVGIKGWLLRERATTEEEFDAVLNAWEDELISLQSQTVYVVCCARRGSSPPSKRR